MKYPHISISILHWKHVQDTMHCLRSLKKSTYPNFDVHLILNGSDRDDKISLYNTFESWDQLTIIDLEENQGFAEGNNIAIREILKHNTPEYIFLLNNDTEVEPDFLEAAVAKALEGFAMVQCLMYEFDDRKKIDAAGIKLTKSGLTFDIKKLADPSPLFCPNGGAVLYSTQLLKACALDRQVTSGFQSKIIKDYLDKDYFAYAEDFDLGFRALLQGFQPALAHTAVVYHKGSASTSTMSDFSVYHSYRNLLFTYLKCYPTAWLLQYIPFIIVGQLAILFKNLTRGQGKVIIAAWRDAWRYRNRILVKRSVIQKSAKAKPADLKKYMSKSFFEIR